MPILINDIIDRLHPSDTYPLMDKGAVRGLPEIESKVNQHDTDITELKKHGDIPHVGETFEATVTQDEPLTYPDTAQGNYIIGINDISDDNLSVPMPTPTGGLIDGTLFTVFNNSSKTITLDSSAAPYTLDDANSFTLKDDFLVSYLYDHANAKFVTLESGYLPAVRVNSSSTTITKMKKRGLIHTVEDLVNKGFLKGISLAGTNGSVTDIKSITFANATVETDQAGHAVVTSSTTPPPESIIHNFKDIAERDAWSAANGSQHSGVVAAVADSGDGTVKWYEWNGSQWVDYHVAGSGSGDNVTSFTKDANDNLILTLESGQSFTVQLPAAAPEVVKHDIYCGFTDKTTASAMLEADITVNAAKQIGAGQGFIITRTDTGPKSYFVWIPDEMGTVLGFGFGFGGFSSEDITVGGKAGKVFVGPHATSAQAIEIKTVEIEG